MSFNTDQTLLSQADFILMKKALKGKSVNFSTAAVSFKGKLEDIYDNSEEVVCISILAPESRKKFTAHPWVRRPEKTLTISLSKRDKIWQMADGSRVYIAFLNTCNMTIG